MTTLSFRDSSTQRPLSYVLGTIINAKDTTPKVLSLKSVVPDATVISMYNGKTNSYYWTHIIEVSCHNCSLVTLFRPKSRANSAFRLEEL